MLNNIPLFIGLRYIRAKRRNQFISFISTISFLGMMLGIFSLIVVLSVMNGFDRELKERILSAVPHGFIYKDVADKITDLSAVVGIEDWPLLAKAVSAHPEILSVAPYISGNGMISQFSVVRGVQINGVLPDFERKVSSLADHFIAGSLDELQSRQYRIVLGSILARQLGVTIGDKVTIILPQVSITPMGIFPRLKRFTVSGVFKVGAQLDGNTAMVHIEDAAKLFRYRNTVEGLRVKVDDLYQAQRILHEIKQTINSGQDYQKSISVKDWSKTQGGLFQAVQMEKTVMTLLLLIVVAVAAFNIISILIMMVADKRSDIAVLRTLGASPRTIMGIFIIQGSSIGIIGTIVGAGIGVPVALHIREISTVIENLLGIQFFNPDIYFISFLPSHLMWSDVMLVCSSALALSFLATLYPAYKASTIQPAEALRYE